MLKAGMKVVCVENPKAEEVSKVKGSGWRLGKKFIIKEIESIQGYNIIWPQRGNGIYAPFVMPIDDLETQLKEGCITAKEYKQMKMEEQKCK